MRSAISIAVAVSCTVALSGARDCAAAAASGKLDHVLDLYVRDGLVYYRALQRERARLDEYLGEISSVAADKLSHEEQVAFWLNAYNALVLQTVIDHYPIRQRTNDYPPRSIRQIPGAFERLQHKVAGRTVTLDQIERAVLPAFQDPRVYWALGRGAVGGGRLRSEAFAAGRLERQLKEVADECARRVECVQIDRLANRMEISPIFSWREKDFVARYTGAAPPEFSDRSPIERAVLAYVEPGLLAIEREVLAKNTFQVTYKPFDWTLNDLTGRGGR